MRLSLTNHSAGGLTEADFELAGDRRPRDPSQAPHRARSGSAARLLPFAASLDERRRPSRSSSADGTGDGVATCQRIGRAARCVKALLSSSSRGCWSLVNAFFVIAEYALVRSRRARLEALAEEGAARRAAGARPARRHRRLHLRLPGRDHDGLDRHRRARRAGDRAPARAGVRATRSGTRRCGRDLGDHRLPADHHRADDRRRDGAEAVRDPARRGAGAPDRAAAAVLPPAVPPVHRRCSTPSSNWILRMLGTDPDAEPEGGTPGRAQADHRRVADRRPARRRRGEHAHRRLPPARAGGAPGDDADPGGRHRRRLRDGRGRAAALRLRPATRGWSSPRTRTRTGSRGSSTSTSSSS